MPKKIYVGNLPADTTRQDVQSLFEAFGSVLSISLESDRRGTITGAVIEMAEVEAARAIRALNGVQYDGHLLTITEARPH